MDRAELKELAEARDKLLDRLINSKVDGRDIDKLMPIINAVDDVNAAFEVGNNI